MQFCYLFTLKICFVCIYYDNRSFVWHYNALMKRQDQELLCHSLYQHSFSSNLEPQHFNNHTNLSLCMVHCNRFRRKLLVLQTLINSASGTSAPW